MQKAAVGIAERGNGLGRGSGRSSSSATAKLERIALFFQLQGQEVV